MASHTQQETSHNLLIISGIKGLVVHPAPHESSCPAVLGGTLWLYRGNDKGTIPS
jgi:hypothetical protein